VLQLGGQSVSQFQLGLTGLDHSARERADDYTQWLGRHGLAVVAAERAA